VAEWSSGLLKDTYTSVPTVVTVGISIESGVSIASTEREVEKGPAPYML